MKEEQHHFSSRRIELIIIMGQISEASFSGSESKVQRVIALPAAFIEKATQWVRGLLYSLADF